MIALWLEVAFRLLALCGLCVILRRLEQLRRMLDDVLDYLDCGPFDDEEEDDEGDDNPLGLGQASPDGIPVRTRALARWPGRGLSSLLLLAILPSMTTAQLVDVNGSTKWRPSTRGIASSATLPATVIRPDGTSEPYGDDMSAGASTSGGERSVVRVMMNDAHLNGRGEQETAYGSGAVVGRLHDGGGLVTTNWHVVSGSNGNGFVQFYGGGSTPAAVLDSDAQWDIAILHVDQLPADVLPFALAEEPLQRGEALTIAGYGGGQLLAQEGTANGLTYNGGGWIELDRAQARQGDSGGPVLRPNGDLVGVLWGAKSGHTMAAHVSLVRPLLARVKQRLGVRAQGAAIAAAPGMYLAQAQNPSCQNCQPAPRPIRRQAPPARPPTSPQGAALQRAINDLGKRVTKLEDTPAPPGAIGPAGAPGSTGATGATGEAGATGATGVAGAPADESRLASIENALTAAVAQLRTLLHEQSVAQPEAQQPGSALAAATSVSPAPSTAQTIATALGFGTPIGAGLAAGGYLLARRRKKQSSAPGVAPSSPFRG